MAVEIITVPYEYLLRFDPNGNPIAMQVAVADVRWVDGVPDLDGSHVRAPSWDPAVGLEEGLQELERFSLGMNVSLAAQLNEAKAALAQMADTIAARDAEIAELKAAAQTVVMPSSA